MKQVSRKKTLDEFENCVKRGFKDDAEDEYSCSVGGIPDDPIAGVSGGDFILTREDLRKIFDPVVNQIISLVQHQIDTVEGQNQPGLQVSV